MKRITDPSFQYVPSHSTDIRKLFEKVRREREEAEALARAGIKSIAAVKRKA